LLHGHLVTPFGVADDKKKSYEIVRKPSEIIENSFIKSEVAMEQCVLFFKDIGAVASHDHS
jgi:hypothetical protein